MSVEVKGLTETLRVLSDLPDDLQDAADTALERFVQVETGRVRARASRVGRQQRLAAQSVRAEGRTLVGAAGTGVPAAIFSGAEFGGRRRRTTQQFRPFRGSRGYFMFPQLRDDDGRLTEAFESAADDIVDEWEGR